METAIKKAIKGGWKPIKNWHFVDETMFDIPNIIWTREVVLLDPLFWKALGKAEKWGIGSGHRVHSEDFGRWFEGWQFQMIRFTVWKMEDGSIEEFFTNLFKKSND